VAISRSRGVTPGRRPKAGYPRTLRWRRSRYRLTRGGGHPLDRLLDSTHGEEKLVRPSMFVRITSALAVAALVVGATSGCGSKSSNTLKVGDIVPLTGDLAPFGPSGEKAARLAVNQANAALKQDGIKLTVKLENADEDRKSTR